MAEIPVQAFTAPETILVVDDYAALCNVAALLLGRCGYRVLTATSGEQAKQVAREHDIDLLLTDVEMPGMQGDELAAWFRATRPRTQVVFMSGNPAQLRGLQPCHFVEKPFIHLDALVKEVREVLNNAHADMPALAAA
jgi:CheY-like chemotaxis protein